MFKPRLLASRLLSVVVRYAPTEYREWANAMLCELDFVEGDWAALLWALGGATTIFRQANGLPWARLRRYFSREETSMDKDVRNRLSGTVVGILLAAALAICAWGLYAVSVRLFPALEADRVPWLAWLGVVVLPEAILVLCAIKFWRNRRWTAFGILLSATVLATHFAFHFASRWNQ
jgi:hypothetical protein